jgi:hypothetical protein
MSDYATRLKGATRRLDELSACNITRVRKRVAQAGRTGRLPCSARRSWWHSACACPTERSCAAPLATPAP